jgi:hypothetical protein
VKTAMCIGMALSGRILPADKRPRTQSPATTAAPAPLDSASLPPSCFLDFEQAGARNSNLAAFEFRRKKINAVSGVPTFASRYRPVMSAMLRRGVALLRPVGAQISRSTFRPAAGEPFRLDTHACAQIGFHGTEISRAGGKAHGTDASRCGFNAWRCLWGSEGCGTIDAVWRFSAMERLGLNVTRMARGTASWTKSPPPTIRLGVQTPQKAAGIFSRRGMWGTRD